MNFFKQKKPKNKDKSAKGPSQQPQNKKQQLQAGNTEAIEQVSLKTLVSSIFSFNKPSSRSKQSTPQQNNPCTINNNITNNYINNPTNQPIPSQQPEYIVRSEDAQVFVMGLCSSVQKMVIEQKMRVSKARNQIFSSIEIEPVYLLENSEHRILGMELDNHSGDLIQRTQSLVLEKNTIDRAIEGALVSGYLWQAHGLEDRPFIDTCYETVSKGSAKCTRLHHQLQQVRTSNSLVLGYLSKIYSLNNKRLLIAKKIRLLAKLKQQLKDALLSIENIDQAFYIERPRQKLYNHFLSSKLALRVCMLQNILARIRRQNGQVVGVLGALMREWIDQGRPTDQKSIEKCLVMLYFVRTEKMYTDSGCEFSLASIVNKNGLRKQLQAVAKWPDYRYVNDPAIKARVREFLASLVKQISRGEALSREGEQANKGNIKIRVLSQKQSGSTSKPQITF